MVSLLVTMNETCSDNVTSIFDQSLIPFTLHPFQVTFRSAAFVIGVPLNLFVAWVIVSSRRLHYARNAIWLGVTLSNLLHLIPIPLEFLVSFQQSYAACQLLVVVAGKPYVILLINLLLATCDRFISTKWPLFHKKHVTVVRVTVIQVSSSIVTFLLLTVHLWAFNEPIQCSFKPWVLKLNLALISIFTLLCVIAKLVVYITVKETPDDQQAPSNDGQVEAVVRFRIAPLRITVCRMERNATMTMVFGLIPLCLSTVLMYVYFFCRFVCHHFFDNCHTLNAMEVYCRELVLLHVSTDLLVYLSRSHEFRAAARNAFHCFRAG